MDTVRYFLGVLLLVTLPGAIIFWMIIHPLAAFWRRFHLRWAYFVGFGSMILVGVIVFLLRDVLLIQDFGTNWVLFVIGLAMYLMCWVMERMVRKHLKFRTLVGVPELKGESTKLLDEGIYALVRHPRYLEIMIAMVGWSMMANYLGMYILTALTIPGLLLVVHFEERELVIRFGDAYRDYQRRVPQIIPTPASFRAAFGKHE